MKRTIGYIVAVALILALCSVARRLLQKDDDLGIHPDTPITVIRVDGTNLTSALCREG